MKVIVISDTHLNEITDAFSEICRSYCGDADLLIHLGDWTRSVVLDYLEQFPLEAVSGNMDDTIIQARLPFKKVVRVGGHRIGMIHGWGYEQDTTRSLLKEFPDVEVILHGHTHRPHHTLVGGVLVFNPGSLTAGRGSHRSTLGILNIGKTIEAGIVNLS